MSHDYETRMRALVDEMYQEEAGIQIVGRALTEVEIRRTNALRRARELVERAIHELAFPEVPPEPRYHVGGPDDSMSGSVGAVDRIRYEQTGPMENFGLAGDEDMPGYGRGGGGRL